MAEKLGGTSLTDITVTPKAVQDKLSKLNPNNAQGPDQVPPRVQKEVSEHLAMPLCILFNTSLESGLTSDDWKLADVAAIFKKGTKCHPRNSRSVRLTCAAGKLLESFLRDAAVEHMMDNSLYSERQHGFQKHRS